MNQLKNKLDRWATPMLVAVPFAFLAGVGVGWALDSTSFVHRMSFADWVVVALLVPSVFAAIGVISPLVLMLTGNVPYLEHLTRLVQSQSEPGLLYDTGQWKSAGEVSEPTNKEEDPNGRS